jgi:hypothetical protein
VARTRLPRIEFDPVSAIGAGIEDRLQALVPREATEWLVATSALAEDLRLVYQHGVTLKAEAARRRWHAFQLDENLADQHWTRGLVDAELSLESGFELGVNGDYINAALGFAQVGSALLRAVSSPAGTAAASVNLARIKKLGRGGADLTLVKQEVLKPPRRHPSWDDDQAAFMAAAHATFLETLGDLVPSCRRTTSS